jgi:sulfite reductase (NADPH) hemoprotein beta-component
LYDLGDLDLNISGCMNACGHHHIGHIGILGVDKRGEEYYQVQLGGRSDNKAAIGKVLGPAFSRQEVTGVIKKLIDVFLKNRNEGEAFVDVYDRIGISPFKETVYAKAS